jgi:hypothetical protein
MGALLSEPQNISQVQAAKNVYRRPNHCGYRCTAQHVRRFATHLPLLQRTLLLPPRLEDDARPVATTGVSAQADMRPSVCLLHCPAGAMQIVQTAPSTARTVSKRLL